MWVFVFFFFNGCLVCRILLPRPGIKPVIWAVNAPKNPNRWTARELQSYYKRFFVITKNYKGFFFSTNVGTTRPEVN